MTKSYSFTVLGCCLILLFAVRSAHATSMQMTIESQIDSTIRFVLNIDYARQGGYISDNAAYTFTDDTSVAWANGVSYGCGEGGTSCYDYFFVELVEAPIPVNNLPPPVFDQWLFGDVFEEVYSGVEYTEGMGSYSDTYLAAGSMDNFLYLIIHQSGVRLQNIEVGYMFDAGGWDGLYADQLLLTVTSINDIVTPVPEPPTIFMLVAGFMSLIGMLLKETSQNKILLKGTT